ncbi:hypothetical protein [Nonomuraea sp. NPDC050783]|uniref:hypothetical protein n=1 Tax=Nonomuraea sp. NPDC050783 TaxID=3154634 RepID=UPI0034673B78
MGVQPPPAVQPHLERLVTLCTRLQESWEQDALLRHPGWDRPFRALGDLLPEADVLWSRHNPQMVPLLWYPAVETGVPGVVDVFDHLPRGHPAASLMLRREDLSAMYSWAIVTSSALSWTAGMIGGRGLVEVGAGSGYWSHQLTRAGIDVIATDVAGAADNRFSRGFQYAEVAVEPAAEAVRAHADRVLLLVWPPHRDPMAVQALRAYSGDVLLYAGEPRGGLCADEAFFDELERHWRQEAVCPVAVRWLGHDDRLVLYRRRRP